MNHRLTPIRCKKCGRSATFEFLFQDQRMCMMCYLAMTRKSKEPLAPAVMASRRPTDDQKQAL